MYSPKDSYRKQISTVNDLELLHKWRNMERKKDFEYMYDAIEEELISRGYDLEDMAYVYEKQEVNQ
jgi:hypothetical protein